MPANQDHACLERRHLHMLMHIPYLPADQIQDTFDELELEQATAAMMDAGVMDVFEYLQRRWLNSKLFMIPSWCLHYREVRTNNDCEGWHHKINAATGA